MSIALLRQSARGYRDMDYFKLKIFQLNMEDAPSFFYNKKPMALRQPGLFTVGNP